jgi:hypothetical protein
MRWLRAAGAVVVALALALVVSQSSCRAKSFPVLGPCTASAIAAPYHGPLAVDSVQSFGCVGQWAYLWATVGSGQEEIGVTEVLHYDFATSRWANVSRLHYCVDHRIPTYVKFWGCNSN